MLQKIFQQSLLVGLFLGGCCALQANAAAQQNEAIVTTAEFSDAELEKIVLDTALAHSPAFYKKLQAESTRLKDLVNKTRAHIAELSRDKKAKCTLAVAATRYVTNFIALLCFLYIYTEWVVPQLKTFNHSDFWVELGKIMSGAILGESLKNNYGKVFKGLIDTVCDACWAQLIACS
jgi:hypothetical protein